LSISRRNFVHGFEPTAILASKFEKGLLYSMGKGKRETRVAFIEL
jgi:hypothetical protein